MLTTIFFVRHGTYPNADGDVFMDDEGISQIEKLANTIMTSDADYNAGVRRIFFCSRLLRGFQTATILAALKERIVVLAELEHASKKAHEKVLPVLNEILEITRQSKTQVAVIVCHGNYTSILAELASEKASGRSARDTLPSIPQNAEGYEVNMKTGTITSVS